MIDFEEYSDFEYIEFEELSDEDVDRITSYVAYYKEVDDFLIKLLLLDDELNVIAKREFDDIDVAEVFLEDYFDEVEIEFSDEDVAEFIDDLDESMKSITDKIKRKVELFGAALGNEAKETKQMAKVFFKQLKSIIGSEKPSEQELKGALEQLKNVNKFALTVTLFALPLGGAALYFLQKLGDRYGFSIFPKSFDNMMEKMIVNKDELKMIAESANGIRLLPYKGFGISRNNMPQLSKEQTSKLIKMAKDTYGVDEIKLPVNTLKLSQIDVDYDKINYASDEKRTIVVSKDYYIVDGHHYVLSLYNKDEDSEVDVAVVDTDFMELFNLSKMVLNME